MRRSIIFAGIGILTILFFASCNKDANDTFKVRMTDSPSEYGALNLEITGVDAYLEGTGWVSLSSESRTVNVLSLTNGAEIELANHSEMKAGSYTRIRIHFDDQATLQLNTVLSNGSLALGAALNLVWDGPQDVEVNIHENITADAGANLLLDFNVAQSVYANANQYFIHPVITVLHNESTGMQGRVQGTLRATVTINDGQHSYGTYINADGKFLLRGIEPGTYDITIVPIEPGAQELQVNNVTVVEGQIREVGTLQM